MTELHLTVLKHVGYKVALEGNFDANRIRIPILRDSEFFLSPQSILGIILIEKTFD